jgi:cell division transport system ATP-binding protein
MRLLYLLNRIVVVQECDYASRSASAKQGATTVTSRGERRAHNKKINSACPSLLYFAKIVFRMAETIIELKHADIFQGDNLILQDVNLTVNKGEFAYLVGKTGTGKSTLLKTLYGELPLTKGEGTVVGYNLRELDWKKIPYLRRNLGVVFQDFQLLTDRNVNDNLKFVLRATGWKDEKLMDEKVAEVLNKVGLRSKGFKMPFELSGGEQQRVDIARALLNSPKVILADEPTGNLDPETSDEVMNLLIHIAKDYGTSVIMATHDYIVVQKFPARMIKTERGRMMDNASITML